MNLTLEPFVSSFWMALSCVELLNGFVSFVAWFWMALCRLWHDSEWLCVWHCRKQVEKIHQQAKETEKQLWNQVSCHWRSLTFCIFWWTWSNPMLTVYLSSNPMLAVYLSSNPMLAVYLSSNPLLAVCLSSNPMLAVYLSSNPMLAVYLSSNPMLAVYLSSNPMLAVYLSFIKQSYQEYIRGRVCNFILWGLPRQKFKFVIDDAQAFSFQVVMHSPLNTCVLTLSNNSIVLTASSGWACSLHARVHQCTVFNVQLNARE